MAWLESHGNLARHPKTHRLMRRMGWTLPTTIGNLHLLWYWALEYAPSGDLTKFEPNELTCDLDLGDATPEQFLDAMIYAGFIDRTQSGFLKLHDWPDYTAKSLRPRFRRNPERWHRVLRSYGLPVVTRRNSRRDIGAPASEQSAPSDASQNDQEGVPPIHRKFSSAVPESETSIALESDSVELDSPGEDPAAQPAGQILPNATRVPDSSTHNSNPTPPENFAKGDASLVLIEIPKALATQPHFGAWWSKLLELYKNKRCPMTAYEQGEVLAMLAKQPFSAVSMLKHSVRNFETSFAALPALGGIRPTNTS